MRSMTGYGQAQGSNGRQAVTVVLKGVNHRYLDLKIKLPDEARASEARVKELLGEELHRGRVDGSAEIRPQTEPEVAVNVRRRVVEAAHYSFGQLREEGLVEGTLTPGDLLRLPEAVSVQVTGGQWADEDEALLLEVTGQALEQLVEARAREGQSLHDVLCERLGALRGVAGELENLCQEVGDEIREGLQGRLDKFLEGQDVTVDPNRLAQEVAILADRSDVREEIDRLNGHLVHFEELCAEDGALGKRLDFLLQEVFRELNTLGSKCRNTSMLRHVLTAKSLAEQMREQVQNVE
jgi:uncharacterized protein (TIGR00255 family)